MLQQYLFKNNVKVSDLAKKSGIPYTTLSDLIHNVKKIDDCKISILQKLSSTMDMDLTQLYTLCIQSYENETTGVYSSNKKYVCPLNVPNPLNESTINTEVYLQHGMYFAAFLYDGQDVFLPIADVSKSSTTYLPTVTAWTMKEYIYKKEGWQ